MKNEQAISGKVSLYACTLLFSAFLWWSGAILMTNEFMLTLGAFLRVLAVALPFAMVVQEVQEPVKTNR